MRCRGIHAQMRSGPKPCCTMLLLVCIFALTKLSVFIFLIVNHFIRCIFRNNFQHPYFKSSGESIVCVWGFLPEVCFFGVHPSFTPAGSRGCHPSWEWGRTGSNPQLLQAPCVPRQKFLIAASFSPSAVVWLRCYQNFRRLTLPFYCDCSPTAAFLC